MVLEPGLKCGSGEPGSFFCVMMDILYHVPHLCGGFFAIFNELNSKTFQSSGKVIDADVDWNTITEVGVYKIQCHEHFKEDKNVPMINSISDFYNYGILLVFSPLVNDNEKRLIQIYIPDIMTSESNRSRIAIRSFNKSFRNWGIVNVSNTL